MWKSSFAYLYKYRLWIIGVLSLLTLSFLLMIPILPVLNAASQDDISSSSPTPTIVRSTPSSIVEPTASVSMTTPTSIPTATPTSQSPQVTPELRAVWIATVSNLDWPSRSGLSIEQQQQEFRQLLDAVEYMNLNAIVVQIKPTADAFYPSKYAPWSRFLTGVQGGDPGYDPLAFMLNEAHNRNLEFHAWFNPYRISTNDDFSALAPDHPAHTHPDWVIRYGGKIYFNPGIPAARAYIEDSIMEVVERYDIDAVHFDDYFYPYPIAGNEFPDDEAYKAFGADFCDRNAWRRNNVNQLVSSLHQKIKQHNPQVQFGISPFGVWRNQSNDVNGSATNAGVTSYDSLHADVRAWIQNNWLDYVAPQIYWHRGFAAADYTTLVQWWVQNVKGSNVRLYIGHAAYRLGVEGAPWDSAEELLAQIELNRQYDTIHGSILFSLKDLRRNPFGIQEQLRTGVYKEKAPPH